MGTRKRAVHVFAVNPYGGRPDQRSHLEGRVANVNVDSIPTMCVLAVLNIFSLASAAIIHGSDASHPTLLR